VSSKDLPFMKIFINNFMDYLSQLYKNKAEQLQERISYLEKLIAEQKIASGETTLDPEFLEKKQRKDRQTEQRIEKPTEKIEKKAEETLAQDIKTV
jgi:hypothetical protein